MRLSPSIEEIRQALACPLPGLAAMMYMIPPDRRVVLDRYTTLPACRHAGALLLLYPRDGVWCFPLTRRTESVETHKGQISLPGGSQEEGESLQETALREAQEEVAADPTQVEVIGTLSSIYIPPSNFCLHPFVAYTPRRPDFRIIPAEVAELIETPLSVLRDPVNLREGDFIGHAGQARRAPFYQVGQHRVWGATAMVLAEFLAVLDSCNERVI